MRDSLSRNIDFSGVISGKGDLAMEPGQASPGTPRGSHAGLAPQSQEPRRKHECGPRLDFPRFKQLQEPVWTQFLPWTKKSSSLNFNTRTPS